MLLFLTELYTQLLLTMGDDEFFSSPSTSVPGNPLTLDELISFSRQMLNIAFPLYWRDDHTGAMDGVVSIGGLEFKWERVRENVTKCLVAIHARE
jgi:ubiquitin-protein ligase E3 C